MEVTQFEGPKHVLGSKAKVLLLSVPGPYECNKADGSRKLKPMQLYKSQVTRRQGVFSLQMFHRSLGLMLIQANIENPCTLLDFPTWERFIEELHKVAYDVIGISSIVPNFDKVVDMCKLIRTYQPWAKIVIGGHISNLPGLCNRIDADYIALDEGVKWFRRYLGQDENQPLRHPKVDSGFDVRACGISVGNGKGKIAKALIPSVGCPKGCNFCTTSAKFGGKGKWVDFYKTGDELFEIMCQLGGETFFVMDENFLLHRDRALRLLELMEQHKKSWSLYVFSSADVLRSYSMDQLVGLGISWVWMGIEGRDSAYTKLDGIDTIKLVKDLQAHGIRVLGSTIIGLDEHNPENMARVIKDAVDHDTDFHQFMLYTPLPGTELYFKLLAEGKLRGEQEVPIADWHGQETLLHRHSTITPEQATQFLIQAFDQDFLVNGPSIVRIVKTTLAGWRYGKNHPDPRIRKRFRREAESLPYAYSALVGASQLYYQDQPEMYKKMSDLLAELHKEFGLRSRLVSYFGGRWMLKKMYEEEKRLAAGATAEPRTFYTGNNQAVELNPELTLESYVENSSILIEC